MPERWVRIAVLGFGIWLLLSPVVLGYLGRPAGLSDLLSGALVVSLASWELWRRKAATWDATALVGAWVMLSTLVLGTPQSFLSDVLAGSAIVLLSIHPLPNES